MIAKFRQFSKFNIFCHSAPFPYVPFYFYCKFAGFIYDPKQQNFGVIL